MLHLLALLGRQALREHKDLLVLRALPVQLVLQVLPALKDLRELLGLLVHRAQWVMLVQLGW